MPPPARDDNSFAWPEFVDLRPGVVRLERERRFTADEVHGLVAVGVALAPVPGTLGQPCAAEGRSNAWCRVDVDHPVVCRRARRRLRGTGIDAAVGEDANALL